MRHKLFLLIVLGACLTFLKVSAQDGSWNTGIDLYSSFVWRGVRYSGPSIQPTLEYTTGHFTIGSWGSAGFDGFMETDLYLSYNFDVGVSIGICDYYYPGTPFFDFSKKTGAHGFEAGLKYETGGLSLEGNYIFNEAGKAGTAGGDMYFEVSYSFRHANLFMGAGNGWHTPDGKFGLVNIGISSHKTLQITESFSIPVIGSVILNPTTEQVYIVGGISF
jgi:hypothetical protein